MSSVRSRIEAIEALAKNQQPEADNQNESTTTKKRFHYPGPNRRTSSDHSQSNNFSTIKPARTQGLTDFESDLQEVWSVRKNIHHQGGKAPTASHAPPTSSSVQTAGHYSRHGAIAAQQSPVLPKSNKDFVAKSHATHTNGYTTQKDDEFSFETKRAPLQEQQSPWNVKKSNYSYNSSEAPSKRPFGSPGLVNGVTSPPTAKRKPNIGEAQGVRPTKANDLMFPSRRKHDEKMNYAKRMANSYLKSVGIGEYTPPNPGASRQPSDSQKYSSSKWKDSDF